MADPIDDAPYTIRACKHAVCCGVPELVWPSAGMWSGAGNV